MVSAAGIAVGDLGEVGVRLRERRLPGRGCLAIVPWTTVCQCLPCPARATIPLYTLASSVSRPTTREATMIAASAPQTRYRSAWLVATMTAQGPASRVHGAVRGRATRRSWPASGARLVPLDGELDHGGDRWTSGPTWHTGGRRAERRRSQEENEPVLSQGSTAILYPTAIPEPPPRSPAASGHPGPARKHQWPGRNPSSWRGCPSVGGGAGRAKLWLAGSRCHVRGAAVGRTSSWGELVVRLMGRPTEESM